MCSVPIIVIKYLPENEFLCLRVSIDLAAQEALKTHWNYRVVFLLMRRNKLKLNSCDFSRAAVGEMLASALS